MKKKQDVVLIDNVEISDEVCRWCEAFNEPHSPACPAGERYKHVQQLGQSGILLPT